MYESINKRSSWVSFLVTVLLTVIFFAVMILVKVPETPKYKTVKITLSEPSVQNPVKKEQPAPEKLPASSEKASEVAKPAEPSKVQETKAEPAKTEAVKSKSSETTKKTEPTKTQSAPKTAETKPADKPKENVQQEYVAPALKKSVEELAAEAAANKKSPSDYDPFADDDDEPQVDWSKTVANNGSTGSLEGSAATGASASNSQAVSASSKNQADSSSSSSTSNALSSLKSTTASTAGRSSELQYSSVNSSQNDSVSIRTDDGKVRQLIYPAKPEIRLSEESAKKISGSVTVKILIKIYADGTVPATFVRFSPSASLPAEVQNEIKNIIRQWKFAGDDSEATATLEYTIRVN